MKKFIVLLFLLFSSPALAEESFYLNKKFVETGDKAVDVASFAKYHASVAMLDLYAKYGKLWRMGALAEACKISDAAPIKERRETEEQDFKLFFEKNIKAEIPKSLSEEEVLPPLHSRIESWRDGYISGYLEGVELMGQAFPQDKTDICKATVTAF